MLRLRLATNLLFNLVLAVWVFHDARTRRARKPLFASLLTLLWGPLGIAFWASDRPLAAAEQRRGGTAWTMARTFVMAVTALLPAAFVLVTDVIRDRSAVPGSLGATLGSVAGSLSVVTGGWALLAGLALLLGAATRHPQIVERGTSAVLRHRRGSERHWPSREAPRSLSPSSPRSVEPDKTSATLPPSAPRARGDHVRENRAATHSRVRRVVVDGVQ
jgi:hypothetical protein